MEHEPGERVRADDHTNLRVVERPGHGEHLVERRHVATMPLRVDGQPAEQIAALGLERQARDHRLETGDDLALFTDQQILEGVGAGACEQPVNKTTAAHAMTLVQSITDV
jgi:hypothetical protein